MSDHEDDAIPIEAVATDEVVKSAEVAFADYYFQHSHTTSEHHVNDVLKHVGKGGVAKRASMFMGSPKAAAVSPGPPSTSPAGGPARRQSQFAIKMAGSTGGGDKCKKCTLTVYLAEKISSSNGIYHKRCFCCGLDGETGCGRTLDAGNYDVYGGVIFCKTCSKKQHHGDKQMKTLSDGPMSPIGSGGERRLSWKGGQSEERRSSADASSLPSPPGASPEPSRAPRAPQSVLGLFATMTVEDESTDPADEGSETEVQPTEAEAEPEAEAEIEADTDAQTAQTTTEPAESAESTESQAEEEEEEVGARPSTPLAAVKDTDDGDEEEDEDEGEDTFEVAPPVTGSPASSPPRERRPSIDPLPGQKSFHECPFTFPFDKNGAIYWVGSMGGAVDYENPQKTGSLYLEISTLYRGQLLNITSYQAAESAADRIAAATYTNNTSKSWLVVDFGPERKLRPSFYCLKHGASGIGNSIRNWTLEGKVEEESPWVELRKHVNDTTMREEPQSVAGYELSSEVCRNNFFRIFRVTQHGKNSGGNDCLFIGAIDFYGIMKVEKALL